MKPSVYVGKLCNWQVMVSPPAVLFARKNQSLNIICPRIKIDITLITRQRLLDNNNNYKTSIAQISSKDSSSVAHLVQELGKLIVHVRYKVHQQRSDVKEN